VRIVLDTNVLAAGLLSPFGPPGDIARMVSSGDLTLCLDARILSEYREVLLRPKFGFPEDSVSALLRFVEYRGHTVASRPLPQHLPDVSDEPFLEVALASEAECLVTGNLAHFPAALRQRAMVLSPAEFMSAYRML
jgi:uncharacterized protein